MHGSLFVRERVYYGEERESGAPDPGRYRALAELARRLGLGVVATNNVHYHVRERHRLQDVLVAIQHRTTLEASHTLRRPNSEFYLKPPQEMARLFADLPEAVAASASIAERCGFDLTRDPDYRFPDYPCPPGETPDGLLRRLCYEEARRRYGVLGGRLPWRVVVAASSLGRLRTAVTTLSL